MFDGRWRSTVEAGLAPVGRGVRRAGVTADALTVTGVVMSLATAVAVGGGHFRLGVLLLALTGIPDALDGAVAKASGTASARGAFFDSVADRLTDAVLLGGVAWWLADSRTGPIVLLPFAVFAAASLVSYQRAKAESLGFSARGGLMERAERFIVLGFGLLFSELLVGVLWVMLVLTAATAAQRFTKVWRQAARPAPPRRRARPAARRRHPRTSRQPRGAWRQAMEERRELWREAVEARRRRQL
ncbi:MAG: CDP-alcohol phosphatidyltransferase family protein [Acidimicrobiales bacterium]